MFEKMTARERVLAMAVLCLVPIALLFMGIFWVMGKNSDYFTEYKGLLKSKEIEESREFRRLSAEKRREYYNSVSLSPRVEDATNEYLFWLKNLLNECNLEAKTFTPRDGGDVKEGRKTIGKRKKFSVPAMGKLDDLTMFLTKFYSVDTLHRINGLKIIPKNESGSNEKKIRSGVLSITLDIEVVSLKTAQDNPDFAANVRTLARSKEDYTKAILERNIFGPANNTPTLSARPSSTNYSDSKANVSVTAKDADEKNILKVELLESSVEGAELVFREGSRTGKLVVPGQEPGKYDFKLKVTDNGFPPKFDIKEFSVPFKERPKKKATVTVEPPKPKPYVNAKQTLITGITKESSGDWRIWVKVRTTGEKYKLLVGDSFKLDDMDWYVKSIGPHSAVLDVEGKRLTIMEGMTFDNPASEVALETKPSESKEPGDAKTSAIGPESDAPPSPRENAKP